MTTSTATAHAHVALNVADLSRSIAFYRAVLGLEPAKVRDDYAKFELADPPLVLTLNPGPPPSGRQRVSHLGIRLSSRLALAAVRERLGRAGVEVRDEDETACCYAVQSKSWVNDPDGNEWEFYMVHGDAPRLAPAPAASTCCEGQKG